MSPEIALHDVVTECKEIRDKYQKATGGYLTKKESVYLVDLLNYTNSLHLSQLGMDQFTWDLQDYEDKTAEQKALLTSVKESLYHWWSQRDDFERLVKETMKRDPRKASKKSP